MKVYKFTVSSADGLTWYQIGTNNPNEVMDFYKRFGHEGNTSCLEILNGMWETFYNEAAFVQLAIEVNK
jgi:hypothetical protein